MEVRNVASKKDDNGGYLRKSSVIVIALLLVASKFEAFLSASITRSIAEEKTIVDEFRIAHRVSLYPNIEAIMASPTYGRTADAIGASRIIKRKILSA